MKQAKSNGKDKQKRYSKVVGLEWQFHDKMVMGPRLVTELVILRRRVSQTKKPAVK